MKNTNILLIEDEKKIRDMITDFLRERGYRVFGAPTARKGLDLYRRRGAGLIILDLMLPDREGMEVCREIRGDSSIPIIMLTARSEEVDRLLGLELGADDYVTKPFSLRELEARIRAILRRVGEGFAGEENGAGKILKFQGLTIDPDGGRVHAGNREVHLTPTEFKLLVTLAENPGRVFSRMQLLDAAFGETYIGYERSVDTHISNLRKKIEPDPSEPTYVITVYGFGYRFQGIPLDDDGKAR